MSFSLYAAWSPTLGEVASARRLGPCLYQIGVAPDVDARLQVLNRPIGVAENRLTRSLLGLGDWRLAITVGTAIEDAAAATRVLDGLLVALGGRGQDWGLGAEPLALVHGAAHGFDRRNLALADTIVSVHHAALFRMPDAVAAGPGQAAQQSFLRRLALHARDLRQSRGQLLAA